MRIQKILCPTDFSEPAGDALSVAGEVAQFFRAKLVVLHVVEPLPVEEGAAEWKEGAGLRLGSYDEMLVDAARESLHRHVGKRLPAASEVKEDVVRGAPAHAIVEAARREKADLIVIATHGRTGLRHLLIGSVAERVVRLAPCPTLTIPWRAEGDPRK